MLSKLQERVEHDIITSKFAFSTFFAFLIFPFLISCGLGGNFCGVRGCDAIKHQTIIIQNYINFLYCITYISLSNKVMILSVINTTSKQGPDFFRLLSAIAKIAFITVRITASLDFRFTVQYMIHFINHFINKCLYMQFNKYSVWHEILWHVIFVNSMNFLVICKY